MEIPINMEEKINEFLELRTNYLNNLKVESANTFFSNKYMFLFGIILKKEYHKYENCYQLELKNFDECENLINLLEIKESERLMNKFKIYNINKWEIKVLNEKIIMRIIIWKLKVL